jgi:hypothetical protein
MNATIRPIPVRPARICVRVDVTPETVSSQVVLIAAGARPVPGHELLLSVHADALCMVMEYELLHGRTTLGSRATRSPQGCGLKQKSESVFHNIRSYEGRKIQVC